MAEKTNNLQLIKQGRNEYISIDEINKNMDIIDQAFSGQQDNISCLYHDVIVTVPTSWIGSTAPYTQEITVAGIKVGDPAEMWSAVNETTTAADAKLWNKMAAMIDCAQIKTDGKLILICKNKKPISEFKIRLKGVSGT